jgi:biotin carboxyl carrier protein
MPAPNPDLRFKVNGSPITLPASDLDAADIIQVSEQEYHVLRDHRSASARVLSVDKSGKKMVVEVEGERFEVVIQEELDLLLEQMGFGKTSGKQVKEIKAPMPGLVLSIQVTEGQELQEGDKLLILEAMKMENSLLLHGPGKIKKINVKPGQAVDKGQILIELE